MNATIIEAMVHYAKVEPTRTVEALGIARRAANYLISVSEKPGSPLSGFPPTYAGEGKKAAKEYAGQIMIHYPVDEEQYRTYSPVDASAAKVALGFLACYRATGERIYLDKAKALADTATRVQRDDGSIPTWWNPETSRDGDWINYMAATANMLEGDWPSTSE